MTAPTRPARPGYKWVTRPIYYRPYLRPWYWFLDWSQPKWLRFSESRTGRFAIWFTPRLIVFLLRLAKVLAIAIFIVGAATLYIFLMFAVGKGAVWKGANRGR